MNIIMVNDIKQVLEELKEIKKELKIIKKAIPDKEMFLTAEEEKLLEESYINEKNGELTSDEDLRKELDI